MPALFAVVAAAVCGGRLAKQRGPSVGLRPRKVRKIRGKIKNVGAPTSRTWHSHYWLCTRSAGNQQRTGNNARATRHQSQITRQPTEASAEAGLLSYSSEAFPTVSTTTAPSRAAKRAFNFNAGPAALPLPVLERIREELLDYRGTGMSVMELSHRSPEFEAINNAAEQNLRKLLAIPDDYAVIFVQGGGSMQFTMV